MTTDPIDYRAVLRDDIAALKSEVVAAALNGDLGSRAALFRVLAAVEGTGPLPLVSLPSVGEAVRQDDGTWLVGLARYPSQTVQANGRHLDAAALIVAQRTVLHRALVAAAQEAHEAATAQPTPQSFTPASEIITEMIQAGCTDGERILVELVAEGFTPLARAQVEATAQPTAQPDHTMCLAPEATEIDGWCHHRDGPGHAVNAGVTS